MDFQINDLEICFCCIFYEDLVFCFDFGGIGHVKVRVIAHQKISVRLMGRDFVWDDHFDQWVYNFNPFAKNIKINLPLPFQANTPILLNVLWMQQSLNKYYWIYWQCLSLLFQSQPSIWQYPTYHQNMLLSMVLI